MNLKEYRESLAWSQAELARKAGISAVTVSKAEKGESINGRSAILICKALSAALGREVSARDLEDLNLHV